MPAPFGGATREQCRGNFQTLTTGLIWLATRGGGQGGRLGGVGQGGGHGGGR